MPKSKPKAPTTRTREAPKPSEYQIQCAFIDLVTLYSSRLPELRLGYAIPNGGMRPQSVASNGKRYSVEAQKLARMGVRKGPSDWCLPVRRGDCCGVYIEFKDHKGKITPEQLTFQVGVVAQGYCAMVMVDAQEAWEWLCMYLTGKKTPPEWPRASRSIKGEA